MWAHNSEKGSQIDFALKGVSDSCERDNNYKPLSISIPERDMIAVNNYDVPEYFKSQNNNNILTPYARPLISIQGKCYNVVEAFMSLNDPLYHLINSY